MKRLPLFILIICFSTIAWAQDAVQTTSSKTIAATGTTAKKKTMKKVKDAVKSGQVKTEAAASTDEANQPPARPGDEEKDPAVWAAYYKAYIAWMKTLGTAERRAAWKNLSRDLLDRVNSHPETIGSAAMQAVFRGLTAEFKAMFAADRAYDKKYAAVVNNLVDAGVKFIKTASYKALSQTDSENFIRSFTGLAVETAWQRSNNSWNGHAVAQIAAFYNGLIDSGSAATKPFAFNQLMHLFRTVRWNSKEGNPELGDQLLKQALQGVDSKTLINGFRTRAGNTALAADERGQAACSLSNILYHQSSLETAFGVKLTDTQVVNITGDVTDVLKGVNSNSIAISDAMRNSLLHLAGCAINQSINRGEQTADHNRLFQHAYFKFAQASLQKSGNASLQATAINMLTSIRNAAAKKDDAKLAATCKKLLLGDVSDLDGFLDKGQEEMGTTKSADHAAWLARALANIAALNKASKTGAVTDAQIKDMVAAIKDWISVEDNLDNMRLRSWQAELYSALAELAKQIYKKGEALGSDAQLKKDFEQIFSTIVGLQDSKVKELAAKYVTSLAADLREQGYGAFANRLEISLCPDSASLMAKAWAYFNKKNYAAARAFCEETISRYTAEALKQQASLKDYAPKGKESLYWALNDVGTAHFILGKIYRAQGQSDQAREEFKTVINKYGFAQCWDKQGWWWKVKDAAKKELSSMNSEPVTMPVIPGTGSTDANGNITITFKSGTLDKSNLSEFWAKVTIDGKTEYWDLGKGAISEDGKSVTLKFDPKYDGKTIAMQFYGFDNKGKQTGYSNAIKVKVESATSPVTMPVIPGTGSTDANGNLTVTFKSGTLDKSRLSGFWAKVTIDGKTEYWDLGKGAISEDGKSVTLKFDPKYDGKTITMQFYGFDNSGKQTGYSNAIKVTVDSALSPVTMPVIPGTGSTDANGNLTVTFKSGTLDKSRLSGFWAKVTIDGKTEYWDLGKGAISEDGTSIFLNLDSKYGGKTVTMQFYGFDTEGKQTGFSNAIAVKVETSGTGGFSGFGQPERIGAGGYTELGYTYDDTIYYYEDLANATDKKVVMLGGSDSWELTGPDGSKLQLNPWSVIIAKGGKSVADVIRKVEDEYVITGDVQILNFQNVYHFERQDDYVFRPENQELYCDSYSFSSGAGVGLQTLPREPYYHIGTPEPQKVEKVVKPGYDISGLPQNKVVYPSFDLLGGAGVENVRAFGFGTSRGGGGWYVIGPDGMEIDLVSGSRMVFADNPKNALEFVSAGKYRITKPVTVLIMLDGNYLDKYTITPDSKTYLEYREYYK